MSYQMVSKWTANFANATIWHILHLTRRSLALELHQHSGRLIFKPMRRPQSGKRRILLTIDEQARLLTASLILPQLLLVAVDVCRGRRIFYANFCCLFNLPERFSSFAFCYLVIVFLPNWQHLLRAKCTLPVSSQAVTIPNWWQVVFDLSKHKCFAFAFICSKSWRVLQKNSLIFWRALWVLVRNILFISFICNRAVIEP